MIKVCLKLGFKRSQPDVSPPAGWSKASGLLRRCKRRDAQSVTFHISLELKGTIAGNHPLFWPAFGSHGQTHTAADHRKGDGDPDEVWKFLPLCMQMYVFDCQIKYLSVQDQSQDVSESKFMKHLQVYTYHNACSSFPLWGRVGWPSGSTALLLFSSPERRIKHSVVIVTTAPQNYSFHKNPHSALEPE